MLYAVFVEVDLLLYLLRPGLNKLTRSPWPNYKPGTLIYIATVGICCLEKLIVSLEPPQHQPRQRLVALQLQSHLLQARHSLE